MRTTRSDLPTRTVRLAPSTAARGCLIADRLWLTESNFLLRRQCHPPDSYCTLVPVGQSMGSFYYALPINRNSTMVRAAAAAHCSRVCSTARKRRTLTHLADASSMAPLSSTAWVQRDQRSQQPDRRGHLVWRLRDLRGRSKLSSAAVGDVPEDPGGSDKPQRRRQDPIVVVQADGWRVLPPGRRALLRAPHPLHGVETGVRSPPLAARRAASAERSSTQSRFRPRALIHAVVSLRPRRLRGYLMRRRGMSMDKGSDGKDEEAIDDGEAVRA